MTPTSNNGPTVLPILSRGRHRHPGKGACFMEYASLLAGTTWSDQPDCTHPLLALIAREVNDETSNPGRAHLVPLIPSVIGLKPSDPRVSPALVACCVPLVVPVVSPLFRPTLTAAVRDAERLLTERETKTTAAYDAFAALALAGAIRAITDFRAPDADTLLRQVLTEAIAECRTWMPATPQPAENPTLASL
ncbi:hypothetical protein [Kribbella sp. CA-294648]|uniref:hypothetical protein n=1 Tax=Kribbella sp. CA-294648 TaxID=3239948 RepID=UPI003D93F3B4